jgi:hypothetical protein
MEIEFQAYSDSQTSEMLVLAFSRKQDSDWWETDPYSLKHIGPWSEGPGWPKTEPLVLLHVFNHGSNNGSVPLGRIGKVNDYDNDISSWHGCVIQ